MTAAWGGVKVESVESPTGPAELGDERPVSVTVDLGQLEPSDVVVEVLHGPVGAADELQHPEVVTLVHEGVDHDGRARYGGSFPCGTAGRHGFTVRVVPAHPDLPSPVELGLIAWA